MHLCVRRHLARTSSGPRVARKDDDGGSIWAWPGDIPIGPRRRTSARPGGSFLDEKRGGPIFLSREPRLIKCNVGGEGRDQYFLTSSVVHCFPSGLEFGVPLDLDFCVHRKGGHGRTAGTEVQTGDLGSDDESSDADDSSDSSAAEQEDQRDGVDNTRRESILRREFKVRRVCLWHDL